VKLSVPAPRSAVLSANNPAANYPPKNSPNVFPTFPSHAILAKPSVPTDGRGQRSPGRRKAVSFGARGPYLWARSLRSQNPGQRGDLPDRGGSGQGFSREWLEPGAGRKDAGDCRSHERNRPRPAAAAPAAFDPRCWSGRAAPPASRRHRKRRPGKSLPRLTRAGGRGRCSVPKGPNATKPPGLASSFAGRRAGPRPEGAGNSSPAGRGRLRQAHFFRHHGPLARAPQVRIGPDDETEPDRRRNFSRAGFWRGCRQGRALPPHLQFLALSLR